MRKTGYMTKWRDEILIQVTHLARDGLTESQMAKALGISKPTFINWENDKPLFKIAVETGRSFLKKNRKGMFDLSEYIYRRLSPKAKKAWRKIDAIDRSGKGKNRIDALMAGYGKRIRQDLFRCALVQSTFNVAQACRKTGISRNTFEVWKRDKKFANMIWEIEEIKKDMFEDSLTRMCLAGDSSVAIHIANTKLKERGYSRNMQLDVNVSGQIDHIHRIALMEDLDLPIGVQRSILSAIRRQKKLVESTVVGDGETE